MGERERGGLWRSSEGNQRMGRARFHRNRCCIDLRASPPREGPSRKRFACSCLLWEEDGAFNASVMCDSHLAFPPRGASSILRASPSNISTATTVSWFANVLATRGHGECACKGGVSRPRLVFFHQSGGDFFSPLGFFLPLEFCHACSQRADFRTLNGLAH